MMIIPFDGSREHQWVEEDDATIAWFTFKLKRKDIALKTFLKHYKSKQYHYIKKQNEA